MPDTPRVYARVAPNRIRVYPPTATSPGGGAGVSDHGALTGLGDDDHAQYHNNTRGDARYYPRATADATFAAIAHNHSGTYQPLDATLTALAGFTWTNGTQLVGLTSAGDTTAIDITPWGESLIDAVNAAAGRTILELGSIATQSSANVSITGGSIAGITDLAIADGGTGASTAAAARGNLSVYSIAQVDAALTAKADLVGGVIPTAQIPSLAVTEFLGTVANEAAMLALTGQYGDWAIRSDTGSTWIITGSDPTQLSNWTAISYPTSPVSSVNGQTGVVVLGYDDVGAAAESHTHNDLYYTESEVNSIVAGRQALDDTLTALAAWNWSSGVEVPTFTAADTLSILRVGTSANNLLQLNSSSQIPAVSGALLTLLNASSLASGTVPSARLGSGTADATSVLYGDSVYRTPPGAPVYEYLWTADDTRAMTAGSYVDLLTTSSLATGYYELEFDLNHTRVSVSAVYFRFQTVTAALAGAVNDNIGFCMVENGEVHITIAATGTWTTSAPSKSSSINSAGHFGKIFFKVTTAGTIKLQMGHNSTANLTLEEGSYLKIRKLA